MKKAGLAFFCFLAVLSLILGISLTIFIGFSVATEFHPPDQVSILCDPENGEPLPDTLTIVTWNTGYAGLGEGMDFFYDGGKRTRASREETERNLAAISSFLSRCGADIIFLQEVDVSSRRSWYTDQFAAYREALPDHYGYFAWNYRVGYVPIPLGDPLGRVHSGLATFTRFRPDRVIRQSYPQPPRTLQSLFDLKRGFMRLEYRTSDGRRIALNNTHQSAFDNGTARGRETDHLSAALASAHASNTLTLTGGDWNQTPEGYSADTTGWSAGKFRPIPVNMGLGSDWIYHYDAVPTVRFLHEPYRQGITPTAVIDFFLSSPGIECLEVRTVDLGFRCSDHNPVIATFVIQSPPHEK